MKTIRNYNTADAINVLVKDDDRDLRVEINEEDGAIWLLVNQGVREIGSAYVSTDEVAE